MSVIVTGVPEFRDAMLAGVERVQAAAEQFVRRGGNLVASKAKRHFATGDSTPEWRSSTFPVPSRRSGNLQASIRTTDVVEMSPGVWMSRTGPTTVYGRRIELGYTGVGKWPSFTTRPFPFLRPGLEDAGPELDELFRALVLEAQVV